MAITTSGTTLTFNDATTQTTAPVNTNANVTSATAVAGTGISVTAVTTTGAATHTVTNTGVTSAVAGRGVSVSASTGAVTTSLAAGTILQVVSVTDTTQYTYSNGSSSQTTYQNITNLVASITPSSSSSKILVLADICASQASNYYNAFFRTTRNGTVIGVGNSSGYNGTSTSAMRTSDGGEIGTVGINYLDSPSSTSSVTYQIQICNAGGSSAYSYVNRPANSSTGWEQTGSSTITLMEIAG